MSNSEVKNRIEALEAEIDYKSTAIEALHEEAQNETNTQDRLGNVVSHIESLTPEDTKALLKQYLQRVAEYKRLEEEKDAKLSRVSLFYLVFRLLSLIPTFFYYSLLFNSN